MKFYIDGQKTEASSFVIRNDASRLIYGNALTIEFEEYRLCFKLNDDDYILYRAPLTGGKKEIALGLFSLDEVVDFLSDASHDNLEWLENLEWDEEEQGISWYTIVFTIAFIITLIYFLFEG